MATFTPDSGTNARPTTVALDLTVQTNRNCQVETLDSAVDYVCTLRFDLARGAYTASLSTYDGLLDSKNQPTGKELSANIAFPVTIEPGTTIPVTLYGLPATLHLSPQNNGDLGGAQSTGFTLPTVAGPQQLSVAGWDAGGYVIAGPGAPVPTLTTSDPYLKVTPPAPLTPNLFGLQVVGSPPVGHVASLTATLTPETGSGGSPLTSALTVAFFYAPQATITEFSTNSQAYPFGIAAGPDGALWFAENVGNDIGRMTTAGSVTYYPIPTAQGEPFEITDGPDGALWFTEILGKKIGRITTSGSITEFPIPAAYTLPAGIVAGPDGAMWFTNNLGKKISIGRITTAGSVTEYPTAANDYTSFIAAGPDGALWFTDIYDNEIARITTAGNITQYKLSDPLAKPAGIAAGPDGALWFAEGHANIGRITTAGQVTEYPIQDGDSGSQGIVAGPDGALWFTHQDPDLENIGRITTAGNVTLYPQGFTFIQPDLITAGPDGTLWFTEEGQSVGRVQLH